MNFSFARKVFLLGAGSGVVLVLALLEMWGSYLDKTKENAAQPHLLRPLEPRVPQVPQAVYEGFPRPWFPEKLSDAAGQWTIVPMEGAPVALSHWKGRVLFINFWSTTCVPCIKEMPGIEKLYGSLQDDRIVFLAVTEEPRSEVRSFLAKRSLKLPVYFSEQPRPHELSAMGFPTTYVVGGDGEIAFRHSGALNWDDDGARAFLRNLAAQTEIGVVSGSWRR